MAGRVLLLGLAILTLVGCSDSTGPSKTIGDGGTGFDGRLDPATGEFVLLRVDLALPGTAPIAVDLVGSNLSVDVEQEQVGIDVVLRNAGSQPLYAPASVWIHDLLPATVHATNADAIPIESPPEIGRWGWEYSDLLGEDDRLDPDESSLPKRWIFEDPGLVAFSFDAELRMRLEPTGPVISGMVFEDRNENGIHERNEGPWLGGVVHLETPEGEDRQAFPHPNGVFRFYVEEPGLYALRLEPIVDCVTCITTADPLRILLPTGPDGLAQSYRMARLGGLCAPCGSWQGSVQLTASDPGDLEQDPYDLEGFVLNGDVLTLWVEFSGCSDQHPFALWAGRPFQATDPVQTWVLLQHDDLGEACRAVWHRTLRFDLRLLQAARFEDFGAEGPIVLWLRDADGAVHELLYEP